MHLNVHLGHELPGGAGTNGFCCMKMFIHHTCRKPKWILVLWAFSSFFAKILCMRQFRGETHVACLNQQIVVINYMEIWVSANFGQFIRDFPVF